MCSGTASSSDLVAWPPLPECLACVIHGKQVTDAQQVLRSTDPPSFVFCAAMIEVLAMIADASTGLEGTCGSVDFGDIAELAWALLPAGLIISGSICEARL